MPDALIRGLQPARIDRIHHAPVENHPCLCVASVEDGVYRQCGLCGDSRGRHRGDCMARRDRSLVRDSVIPVTSDLCARSDEIASPPAGGLDSYFRSSIAIARNDIGSGNALAARLATLSL